MDSDAIEKLLEKYWNCETSVEEEQQLKAYFRSGGIPEPLRETAALFRYLDQNKKKTLNDSSFDQRVIEKIRAPKSGKIAKLVYNSMRIAAGVAVLVTATWFVRNELRTAGPVEAADTYSDPKLALEETKKALMMISKTFGAAKDEAKKINMFNEAQEKLQTKQETETEL